MAILVAGGSGFIGSAAVSSLMARGEDVVVMTAHPSRSRIRIGGLGARPVTGDIRDAGSLARAVRGMRVVIQALTFPTFPVQKPRRGYTFEEFEARGTRRLVDAAASAGVRRYVFVSGAGASPDAPQVWFRAKWKGEQAVRSSGMEHVVLRPSWAYGPGDRALNRFVSFHRWLPFVPVVGDGRQRLQPVFVEDVGEALSAAAEMGGPQGTFEIGGPEVLTMDEVLLAMMEARGRPKPMVHFPPILPKAAGLLVQALPTPPLSPGAVDFLLGDALADTGPLLRAFPGLRLRPLREGLAAYLSG